jgi:hypothetical protein
MKNNNPSPESLRLFSHICISIKKRYKVMNRLKEIINERGIKQTGLAGNPSKDFKTVIETL